MTQTSTLRPEHPRKGKPIKVAYPLKNARDPTLPVFRDACKAGHLDRVIELANGRDRNDGSLNWGLDDAVAGGHVEVARYLLDEGVMYSEHTLESTTSEACLELLLRYGWEVNGVLPWGRTLLPIVISKNRESLVRWFLEHGADPNYGAPRSSGTTVLDQEPVRESGACLKCAAKYSTPAVFDLLLQYGAKLENSLPLHAAAVHHSPRNGQNRIPMMEYLLRIGVDINGRDDLEWPPFRDGTALHSVARWGTAEAARFLVENGADTQAPNPYGVTPLGVATGLHGPDDVIDYLRGLEKSHS